MLRPIAADTGGTFTDLVYLSEDGRSLSVAKALTTYDAPMNGLMECVARAGVDPAQADALKFGTTLVINAFLQRKGARTAMVATRGFRDTLEIRRGNRVIPFDVRYARDPVLVPRSRRYELDERIDASGAVVRALDLADVQALAEILRNEQVEAVAVSFLNAYLNASHEAATVEILRRLLPGVFVTAGSDLTREWYEYERASTAAANAYVGPALDAFLKGMQETLSEAGFKRSAYLMASNGGVFSLDEARRQPVQLVESGPVGGCIGAAAYSRELGLNQVIAFDMGGTTAKCALIENGGFETRSPYYVGGLEHGFPIRGAVIDIVEVGAGGGSIASLDAQQRLTVGPDSAGSTPGPACYGLGGQEPTITDANVALGRIGESSFLGGEMRLYRASAEAAIANKVAAPLGYSVDQLDHVAQGILDIGALTMSSAISKITTERGLDPRDFTLFVFGGGGPLHGVDLARHIGIPRVIVPPHPGVFSAVGMLLADARIDESRTFLHPVTEETVATMLAAFTAMEASAASRLPDAQSSSEESVAERYAELRFKGQRHALKTRLGAASSPTQIRDVFVAAYQARFGYADEVAPFEFVALAITVSRSIASLSPSSITPASRKSGEQERYREVFFKQAERRIRTRVITREELAPGDDREGPLVVEEYGSSTVIGPKDRLRVGRLGELIVEVQT